MKSPSARGLLWGGTIGVLLLALITIYCALTGTVGLDGDSYEVWNYIIVYAGAPVTFVTGTLSSAISESALRTITSPAALAVSVLVNWSVIGLAIGWVVGMAGNWRGGR